MKIIVPTDFSDFANFAFNTAFSIAKKQNASLELIHIIQAPIDWVKMDVINPNKAGASFKDVEGNFPEIKKIVAISKAKIHDLKNTANKQGVEANTHVLFNVSLTEAINLNAENDSMVVMGSHGSSGFKEIAIGSNAQKVVREILHPVLVIKNECNEFNPKNIVYTSSFEESELNKSVGEVKKIAQIYNSKIHLLYVNTPANFNDTTTINQRIEFVVKDYNLTDYSINIFNHFAIEYGINDFLSNEKYDLLVMPSHNYTGLMRFVNFGVVENIVNHVNIPILRCNVNQK